MASQNATNHPAPPPGFLEYLSHLYESGALHPPTAQTPVPPAASATPPPTNGRSFTRPNRGQGGALAEKQKVSKQITATATKRKSLVDPEIEVQSSPTPDTASKRASAKPAKRPKVAKKQSARLPRPEPPQSSSQLELIPDPPTHLKRFMSPISTPTPPRPVRPMPQVAKPPIIQPLHTLTAAVPLNNNDDEYTAGAQDDRMDDGSDDPESEPETPTPMGKRGAQTLVQHTNSVNPLAGSPLNVLQAYLVQTGIPSLAALQGQLPPTVSRPQNSQAKVSRGVKAYPDGWRKVLNSAKDIVRSSVLLMEPFPGPGQARITVNECFHEALTVECDGGTFLEPGVSWCDGMMTILLNEISTCRGELKKLAKILVGSDPELFPSPENHGQPFKDQTAPEIRVIASKSSKKSVQPNPFYDRDHICTTVANHLTGFAFLNDPPTVTGEPLTNPILKQLCQSFYEEEKWQRALMVHINGDDGWATSVTTTMVAFAATGYYNALEEWRSGSLVPKPFETDKFIRIYTEIHGYITGLLDSGPHAEQIADYFRLWAEESAFVQELSNEGDE